MNIPVIRKDDARASMQSMNIRNSSDELLRQLAERARTQRLRHQLERSQSAGSLGPAGSAGPAGPAGSRRGRRAGDDKSGSGLRKPA